MDTDWSVELGHDDPALEFLWTSDEGAQRYVDLSRGFENVEDIPEAREYHELAGFLMVVNAPSSPWMSAKCDVWLDRELGEVEQIYGSEMKMCSYVDLIRRDPAARFSFELHEQFVKRVTLLLRRTPDAAMACEFIVRRCWYHGEDAPQSEPDAGFYVTVYVFGYGDNEIEARSYWCEALTRISSVVVAPEG